MIALAELHLLNQDLDACQSILQTVLKNNKDNDQATLVCNIYQYLFLSLREVYDPKAILFLFFVFFVFRTLTIYSNVKKAMT